MARRGRLTALWTVLVGVGVLSLAVYTWRDLIREYWLVLNLDRVDRADRRHVLEELARLKSAHAISHLVEVMRDDSLYPEVGGRGLGVHTRYGYMEWGVCTVGRDWWEKNWPARALVTIGEPSIEALVEVLMGDHRWQSHTASWALSLIGARSVPALGREMVHPLENQQAGEARVAAQGGVRRCGVSAYSPRGLLLGGQTTPPPCNVYRYRPLQPSYPALTLGIIGEPAVPVLLPLLDHESRDVRVNAAAALGTMATAAEPAVPRLIELLGDEHWLVRWTCAAALSRVDRNHGDSIPALYELLDDPSCFVRNVAVRSLGKLGTSGRRTDDVITVLTEAFVAERDIHIRIEIAKRLAEFGTQAERAAPVILDFLSTVKWQASGAFVEALAALGPRLVPQLRAALRSNDQNLRVVAVMVLSKLGRSAHPAMPELIVAVQNSKLGGELRPSPFGRMPLDPRAYAAQALGNIGPEAKVAPSRFCARCVRV